VANPTCRRRWPCGGHAEETCVVSGKKLGDASRTNILDSSGAIRKGDRGATLRELLPCAQVLRGHRAWACVLWATAGVPPCETGPGGRSAKSDGLPGPDPRGTARKRGTSRAGDGARVNRAYGAPWPGPAWPRNKPATVCLGVGATRASAAASGVSAPRLRLEVGQSVQTGESPHLGPQPESRQRPARPAAVAQLRVHFVPQRRRQCGVSPSCRPLRPKAQPASRVAGLESIGKGRVRPGRRPRAGSFERLNEQPTEAGCRPFSPLGRGQLAVAAPRR